MFLIFLVLITIVCFLLIVVIMVQNPKGGGLSSSIGVLTQSLKLGENGKWDFARGSIVFSHSREMSVFGSASAIVQR